MSTDTDKFAKVAGISTGQFTKMVNEDLYGAFIKVVEGVGKGGQQATQFSAILDELGLDGIRTSEVIGKLSSNTDLLADKVGLAGKSIKETTSVLEENAIKQKTLAGQIDRLKKGFVDFVTSPAVTQFLANQIDNVIAMGKWLKDLPAKFEQNRTALFALLGVWLAYKGAVIQATVASWANTTAEVASRAAKQMGARWTVIQTAASSAYSTVTGVLTGKITLATAAQRAWNLVTSLNPFVAIVAGIIALVEVVDLYRKNTTEAIQLEKDKKALSDQIVKVNEQLKSTQEEINTQIQKFNQLSPIERKELLEKIKLKIAEAKATQAQMEIDRKQIEEKSRTVGSWDYIMNAIGNLHNSAAFAMANFEDANENADEAGAKYKDGLAELSKEISSLEGQYKSVEVIQNAFSDAMKISANTTDALNNKLSKLRIALGAAVIGSEEFKKIQTEIDKVQKQLSAGVVVADPDTEKVTKALEDLKEELKEMERAMVVSQQSLHQQEISNVEDKYDALREKAHGNSEALVRIDELEKKELAKLEEDHNKIIQDLQDKLHFSRLSKDEQELQQIRDNYQKQIEAFIGFDAKIKELEALRDAEIAAKGSEHKQRKLEEAQDLEDKIRQMTQTSQENEIDAEANKWEEIIIQAEQANDILIKNGEQAAYDVEALIKAKNDSILLLMKQHNEQQLAEDQKALKKKREIYQQTLQSVASITTSVAEMMTAGLQMLGAEEGQFAEFHKAIAFAQIVSDTAMAISSLVAASEGNPWNSFTAGAAGVAQFLAGMARITVNIASAKKLLEGNDIPKYEFRHGGKLPGPDRVIEGPSHEAGGLTITNSQTGQELAEMEGGEPVISREGYFNNKPVVDAIMDAKGENAMDEIAQILKMENGGYMPAVFNAPVIDSNPPMVDSIRLRETIRIEKSLSSVSNSGSFDFSQFGEMLSLLKSIDSKLDRPEEAALEADVSSGLNEAIERLNQNLENPKPHRAYMVFQDWEKAEKEMKLVRSSSGLKR